MTQLVNGVDALFGGQACVRSASVNDNFDFANSFAGGL